MKYARVLLDTEALTRLLGLPEGITIVQTQMDWSMFPAGLVQLVLTGEALPESCQHREGVPIKEADLIIHTGSLACEIRVR